MNIMRKIPKKLYIAVAVLLCVGITLVVSMTPSDADEQKQGECQDVTTAAKQEKGKSEEDSYNTNQIVSKEKEKNEKEGDYQEARNSKEAVISDSPKEKTESKPTQDVPKHTHSWEPIYSVKTDYESVEIYGIRCNNCGYSTTVADDLYNHIDKDPFDQCGSYSTGVVIRTEQNEVKTKYISGYKCSCGAEK